MVAETSVNFLLCHSWHCRGEENMKQKDAGSLLFFEGFIVPCVLRPLCFLLNYLYCDSRISIRNRRNYQIRNVLPGLTVV